MNIGVSVADHEHVVVMAARTLDTDVEVAGLHARIATSASRGLARLLARVTSQPISTCSVKLTVRI